MDCENGDIELTLFYLICIALHFSDNDDDIAVAAGRFLCIRIVELVILQFSSFHSFNIKKFDEMWDTPRFYISACSNSVQSVRLYPILMSILLYHYKQLTQCISEVERIESRVNSRKKEWVMKKKKEEEEKQQEEEEVPTTTTLDSYFIRDNANFK